jgi:hypothetical protein
VLEGMNESHLGMIAEVAFCAVFKVLGVYFDFSAVFSTL